MISVDNSILNQSIYAMNTIELNNVTVPYAQNINVAATALVKINNNTTLKSGRYFNQNITCNTFKINNSNNNDGGGNSSSNYTNENNFSNLEASRLTKSNTNEFVEVFPNPSNLSCKLKYNLTEGTVISSSLFDITGKFLFSILPNISVDTGSFEIILNTANMSNGLYLLKTTINNSITTNKLIVTHD